MHSRITPVKHQFNYPVYFYLFDLAELEALDRSNIFFGYNRFNLASIDDRDYLKGGRESIQAKLMALLDDHGCAVPIQRIELITCARYFGYVFNPVSFYLCYNEKDLIQYVVAEVRNTFGEMHLYLLKDETAPQDIKKGIDFCETKVFHVSPFFDRAGEYQFHFKKTETDISIQVNLYKDNKPVLLSSMKGQAKPLTAKYLFKTAVRYPFSAALTIPRIHGQAFKLYFEKKLKIYKKPPADHKMTIRIKKPNWMDRRFRKLAFSYLEKLQEGRLTLSLPDGERVEFGGKKTGLNSEICVSDSSFF